MWKKIKSIFGKTETDITAQDNGTVVTTENVEATPVDIVMPDASDVENTKGEIKTEKPRFGLLIADAVAEIVYDLGLDFMKSDQSVNAMADYGAFQNQRASATIYKTLSNEKLLNRIWDLSSSANIDNTIASIKQQVIATYGFNDALVESILWEIVLGLGLVEESEVKSKIARLSQPVPKLPENTSAQEQPLPTASTGPYDPDTSITGFTLPRIESLLSSNDFVDIESILSEGKKRIEWVLQGQGIAVNGITAYGGPRVSLYEIDIDPRKASRVSRMEKEILAALSPTGSRIINPLPGKLAIGIELPNSDDTYSLSVRDVFDNDSFRDCDYELPIALGIDALGNAVIKDLAQIPHILICGEMQQGKTTLLRQIVASLLLKKNPERVKFTFIDTSSLDLLEFKRLSAYWMAQDTNDSDHSVLYDSNNGMRVLNDLVNELESRRTLFQDAGVRDITEYNRAFCNRKLNPQKGHRYLPYIVVLYDEIAPLQSHGSKTFDSLLATLMPKAGMAGIHCIFTTKYTSTDTLTQTVRSNFPAKIAFRIHLPNESRLVIGNNQSTSLLPNGDIILSENGLLTRCQVSKCDGTDIMPLIDEVNNNNLPDYPYLLPETILDLTSPAPMPITRDPLLEEAARFLVSSGLTANTSSLQRRYSIGYNRAGRIMDELESIGVVGPAIGAKPRQVLVDYYTLDSIFSSL